MKLASIPVALEQCAKTFHGQRVLEPLDLAIGAGETLVLLGPSGCGKTTTLRLIAGLETPDAGGRVLFDGDDVSALPIERREVGMVFQSYALFPNLNVRGNIGYGLRIKKTEAALARRRVDELLELMQLTAHAGKPIDQLSGGQRQRVALARALAPQPRVLLLDEPLTALDARLRDTLRTDMNTLLRGLGVTTVYVTHDQAEAMALGDRIVVMSAGRIEQLGTPRDIYYRPATRAVAQFVGTLNRLAGELRGGALVTLGGAVPLGTLAARHGAGHDEIAAGHAGAEPPPAPDAGLTPRRIGQGAAELFFRPEDAALTSLEQAHLRGTIVAALFLGERTRLTIAGAAPDPLIIDVAGRISLAAGTQVGLIVRPDGLVALP